MTIEIQYAIHTPDLGEHVCNGGYGEAVALSGAEDEIWVHADGRALMALPPSFNRLVACEDGESIHSAVLVFHELMPFDNRPPLPPQAPHLMIDHLEDLVVWATPGDGVTFMRILYDKGGSS